MLQRYLLIWLVLSSVAALWWPPLWAELQTLFPGQLLPGFDPLLSTLPDGSVVPRIDLGYVVALTMFAVGTLLTPLEVSNVLGRWPLVLSGTTIQYVSMPLLGFGLAHLFHLPHPLLVGVILVGCVPGAMASNVLTLAAGGNVSYSVSLTTTSTLLSPVVVPVVLALTLGAEMQVDAVAISAKLAREVVGPVVIGHLLCRTIPAFARFMQSAGPSVANLAILLIIATVVAANRERLEQVTSVLIMVLLLLNLLGYLAGYLGGKLLQLDHGMQMALSLEVGMQNAGIGTSLAMSLFEPASAIPTAGYTFGCMLTGTLLAQWWGRKSHTEPSGPCDQGPRPPEA